MATKLKGLPLQIVRHLKGGTWQSKGSLTEMKWYHNAGKNYGVQYLPETVGRALRKLEEKSIIAVKPCGISVQYKHIPVGELRERYIPTFFRDKRKVEVLFKPKQ